MGAEADPYYAYGLGYAHHGYALGLKSAPCVNAANVPVPCAAGYAGHYLHAYGKRDAEAKAEADPYYGYGYHGLGCAGLGYRGLGYAHHGVVAAPAVVAAAPAVVAPVATVHNAVLGTAALPNPVHAVAHTGYGAVVHSSHIGVCTNYLGEQVSC